MSPPEHARTDDDNVKWIAAVVTHLGPRAAHPSAQDIVGECGLLHIDNSTRSGFRTGSMKASILVVSLVRLTLTGISVFSSIGPNSMTMEGFQHTSVPWECLRSNVNTSPIRGG
jgi:hypothetical protein